MTLRSRRNRALTALLIGCGLRRAEAAVLMGHDWKGRWSQEWWAVREVEGVCYGAGESWQQMLRQGAELLQQFVSEHRVNIAQPQASLQRKVMRRLDERNDFIGYVDAVGTIDGQPCLIDGKTSGSSYPPSPTLSSHSTHNSSATPG